MKYLIIICTVLFMSCKGQNTAQTTKINRETLQEEVIGKDVQFIDVRSSKEYNSGHIENAINIDIANKDNFKKEISKLDKSKPIYIYCLKGGRSHKASKVLEAVGFSEVYDFSGGWKAWNTH